MRFCFRAVAGLMVIAWALPIVVGQPPGPGAPSPPAPGQPTPGGSAVPQPVKPQLKVKVFKLERGDLEAVLQSLHALLGESDLEVVPPMAPGGAPRGGMGAVPPSGFGGVPGPGAEGPGFGFGAAPAGGLPGGGFCGFLGNGGANATPVWRATAQARTRSVIVRGADRHLSVAADVVALLERPADAPLPKLQVVKAFALKHATAEELVEVIQALSFEDVKVATPDKQLLALVAPDDVVKSIAELVKELDVPSKVESSAKPKQ